MKMEIRQARIAELSRMNKLNLVTKLLQDGNSDRAVSRDANVPLRLVNAVVATLDLGLAAEPSELSDFNSVMSRHHY